MSRSRNAADLVGLTLQDLLDEVVDDVAVVAREASDEASDVVAPLHRQAGQLQRCDPALGPVLQRRDVGVRQPERPSPR